jgi:hypothetical protein
MTIEERRQKVRDRVRAWKKANPSKVAINAAKYRDKNKAYFQRRYEASKDIVKARSAAWYRANKDKVFARFRERRRTEPEFAIKSRLRTRLATVLRLAGVRKLSSTMSLTGCDASFLVGYIEAKFEPGMTWDNRSMWEVDHIRPCDSFDLTKPEEQAACFHYSNLQPLWKSQNRQKSNHWTPKQN